MLNGENSILDDEKSIIIHDEAYFYGKVQPKVLLSEKEKNEILSHFPTPRLLESEKSIHIKDLKANEEVKKMLVLVNQLEVKKASNNKPYLELVLSNSRGSFKAKLWSDEKAILYHQPFFEKNKAVVVSGEVNEFPKGSGNKSLVIRTFSKPENEINPLTLLPVTNNSFEEMTLELVYYLKQLKEPHRTIAFAGLKNIWNGFSTSPGAKFHHHAYVGGLLKHTLGLIRLSWYIGKKFKKPGQAMFELLDVVQKEHKKEMTENIVSDNCIAYKKLTWGGTIEYIYELIHEFAKQSKEQEFDPDLLISSAFYHDLGKYFELSMFGFGQNKYSLLFPFASDAEQAGEKYNQDSAGITMDELGSFVGHIPYGFLYFQNIIKEEGLSVDLKTLHQYMHNILSHHGKLDWGSSVVPKTPTAVALHFVDYLDSRYENYDLKQKH